MELKTSPSSRSFLSFRGDGRGSAWFPGSAAPSPQRVNPRWWSLRRHTNRKGKPRGAALATPRAPLRIQAHQGQCGAWGATGLSCVIAETGFPTISSSSVELFEGWEKCTGLSR